jgi:hypothetical protein
LIVGMVLVCLTALAAAYLAGALPGGIGQWFGASTPVEEAKERVFLFDVRDGNVPDDLKLIRVTQGDFVTLKWTADRPMILHLHGYDIEREASPGSAAEFAFRAYIAGRFPIEVHDQGRTPPPDRRPLIHLEVYPR